VSTSPQNLFPQRLSAARLRRGLSQDDLAKRANLQPSAISHFETGTRKPSFDNLKRLADALEVSADYLLGRSSEPFGIAEAEPLYRDFENLTAENREIARDFLEALAKRDAARKGGKPNA